MTTTDPRAWLDEIKARADGATEGPWEVSTSWEASGVDAAGSPITWDDHGGEVFKSADAEFIAHARTDVDDMAAALTAVLDALDHYPVPSRLIDPTGQILAAMEGLEQIIRSRITDALGGDRG